MIDLLDNALRLVERAMEWLVAVLVLGLVVIVASQFIDRHFVSLPMAAPDAYARVMLVWLTFIGFALAVKNGHNIRVDLIDTRLPPFARRALEYVFDAVMLLLTIVIGTNGWRLVVIGHDQERLGTVLSEAWPSGALFVACIILSLFIGLRVVLRLAGREVVRQPQIGTE
ncbi:MAG: TRAP transporter small permease subunit [Betaproteobacteria bacterium]